MREASDPRSGHPHARPCSLTGYIRPTCISWTLSQTVTLWFATHRPRVGPREGEIHVGRVARSDVLAYLTSRTEVEVIVDPAEVSIDDVPVAINPNGR